MEFEGILLRFGDVQKLVPISRAKIYDLIKQQKFPSQVKIGGSSLWKKEEIIEYINNLQNK